MAKKEIVFFCTSCGYETSKWLGKCPSCNEWNSFKEEKFTKKTKTSYKRKSDNTISPVSISDISIEKIKRYDIGMSEFNRVLGGGVVPSSLILLGGEPGIGKSTIMLQSAEALSKLGQVLYISGEESAVQVKMRSDRLNISGDKILFLGETNLDRIESIVLENKPEFLIIDSIQTLYISSLDKMPGSISQIREATARLLELSKTHNIATFVIGHVTKDGMIAGPKILEHIVDTVLYFESKTPYLILRAVKNRFGNTDEIGIFNMEETGISEVKTPSSIFMDNTEGEGIALSCIYEGSRPLLIELQALISNSTFAAPRRIADGVEINKINKIIAVLEKRLDKVIALKDVYINIVGGLKIKEPAIDLAVTAAVLSSYYNKKINKKWCFIGELGLTGEIRHIHRLNERISEVARLGIEKVFIPKYEINKIKCSDIEVVPIDSVKELINKIFKNQ